MSTAMKASLIIFLFFPNKVSAKLDGYGKQDQSSAQYDAKVCITGRLKLQTSVKKSHAEYAH